MLRVPLRHELVSADDRVLVAEARAAQADAAAVDHELVVEHRRRPVAAERLEDERLDPTVAQRLVTAGERAEVFDARDLEPHEVGRVVRDPLRIGVREAHAHRRREGEAVHERQYLDMSDERLSDPSLPRWFGRRATPGDPAVSALIDRVARGAGWADIGGAFNLNLRIDAEPPVVLRVHRPWVRRGRVVGLRRLRDRLHGTHVRVARPVPILGHDIVRVADRWAELEEFIDHEQPRADEDSYVRLFEELGRFHTALDVVWEPGPPEPLDDHRTFAQLRYSVGFTRRRLGPGSEPVVQRMRQLTGELSQLREEVVLPCAPLHGDYKLGNAGELSDGSWVTFDLDFARVRERVYDIAASLHHVDPSGEVLEPQRLLEAYEGTAPEPLTRDEHRWLPGALALIPLHWAATAGLVGDGIIEAESAVTAAEAWWSRRGELSA
jgi:hypothetical protein